MLVPTCSTRHPALACGHSHICLKLPSVNRWLMRTRCCSMCCNQARFSGYLLLRWQFRLVQQAARPERVVWIVGVDFACFTDQIGPHIAPLSTESPCAMKFGDAFEEATKTVRQLKAAFNNSRVEVAAR